MLSSDRTWTNHISYLIQSVQPSIVVIRQLAKIGSMKIVAKIARATVISRLTYGIQAWGGTTVQNRQRIQVIINMVARLIIGSS